MKKTRISARLIGCAALLLAAATVAGCATAAPSPAAGPGGPGGSGVASAAPTTDEIVDRDTACRLAQQSATLTAFGAVGEPADTAFIAALSYCQVTLSSVGSGAESLSIEVLSAADVAARAQSDPTVFSGTLVPLPDIGDYGHYLALTPGVVPATNPRSGSITAAQGELGVAIAWATGDQTIAFAEYEQIVLELLGALP